MGNFDEYLMWQQITFMQKHSSYGMLPLQSIKTQMGDDNMEQRKFKVGDKVKVNIREPFKPSIGEVIYINDKRTQVSYLVGVKGFNGHSGDGFGGEKIAKQKGYDKQCWWYGESDLELLEEKKMTRNKVINTLMEELGVEVGEEFEIAGWDGTSPYHFNEDGELIDSYNLDSEPELLGLIYKRSTIKKVKKPEAKEMTVAEIEKELGYAIKVVKEKK